ncbi:hypothetical protein [Cryobacterium zhongshanensis]|uniref:Uncharacterized protein n=1 Tax=Cryobacterium zhongshanensis TaxID=2928153 RepID=A0AA41QXK8_9MICO|nr:hypothetical protein [Cryobacterium zhongshanensis]MCI4659516.1 hypothetical protein [Cryobacterium zhongshanensis]
MLAISIFAGAEAFNVANGNAGSRPAAPLAGFVAWLVWLVLLTAVGFFITLLAYLLVLPSRSRGLWIAQIVLTSLAAIFALIVFVLTLHVLPNL